MDNAIEIKKLYFKFTNASRDKGVDVFDNLNLSFNANEVTAIIGHSGCGKTTLLKLIMGLIKPINGEISINNNIKLGMMFQDDRLLPYMTLKENIVLGLKKYDIDKLNGLIALIGLNDFKNSYPFELSGGMRQRVTLARTLMHDSNFLLMDEPFSALDEFTRRKLQDELITIKNKLNIGIIFVTHSIDEAYKVSNKIFLIQDNKTIKMFPKDKDNIEKIKSEL